MLEVREHAAGLEELEDLAVERALAVVLEMVDGHRRDDGVEAPECGQRLHEVVFDELDAFVAGEALAGRVEHELGEVQAHPVHAGPVDLEQGEQAAVAGSEVEDAARVARHLLGQHALSLRTVPDAVGQREVPVNVRSGGPFLGGHRRHGRTATMCAQ